MNGVVCAEVLRGGVMNGVVSVAVKRGGGDRERNKGVENHGTGQSSDSGPEFYCLDGTFYSTPVVQK